MRLKFIGNPAARDDRDTVTVYGVTFPLGAWVDVSGMAEHERLKLASHNHFEAEVGEDHGVLTSTSTVAAVYPDPHAITLDPDEAAQIAISKKLRKSRKSDA